MAPEILNFNTLAPEKPLARIQWADEAGEHDETFQLLVPEEIGTVQLARISRLYTEHDELWEKADRSKTEDKRLEKLSNELAQIFIPDAPAVAIQALSAIDKRGLAVRFFVGAGLASKKALGEDLVSQLTSNLLGSPGSTEEEPGSGSASPDQS
jgi:hypothetical protein